MAAILDVEITNIYETVTETGTVVQCPSQGKYGLIEIRRRDGSRYRTEGRLTVTSYQYD